jgi:hypothetical protein
MHGLTCHNAGKDGDQNIDSPCDQLDYNVGTLHYDVELEQGKLKLQVKLKLLEGIQH